MKRIMKSISFKQFIAVQAQKLEKGIIDMDVIIYVLYSMATLFILHEFLSLFVKLIERWLF